MTQKEHAELIGLHQFINAQRQVFIDSIKERDRGNMDHIQDQAMAIGANALCDAMDELAVIINNAVITD